MKAARLAGLATLLAVIVWSYAAPADRLTWWLEASPALAAVIILLLTNKTFPLTPLAYALIWVHCVILLIGAHYTYAQVPAFNWLRDAFDLSRNYYDRLGHFVQGFVPAVVARELLIRTSPLRPGRWLFAIVTLACVGISGIYEMIEWTAAELSGQAAAAFLATQGDVWDTQKDMALALLGAVTSQLSLGRLHDRQIAPLTADRNPATPAPR